MTNAQELLSREEYEARHGRLTAEKQQALREVVLAKRKEIYEKVKKIVEADPFSVRPEDREDHMEFWHDTSPGLDPVRDFYLELGELEGIISGTRQRFWPHEGNWQHVAESHHAAICDTDTCNPVLAAISETYNPQILETDKARLRSIVQALDTDASSIDLTKQEEDRLFLPLSGRVIGKHHYVSSFTIEQLLQRKVLTPASERSEAGTCAFKIESPQGLAEIQVQLRRQEYGPTDMTVYDLTKYNSGPDQDDGYVFYVQVPKDLEALWQSLFDRRTQKLLRTKVDDSPYHHPLSQSKKATMKIPVMRRGEKRVPMMHADAQVVVPESELLDAAWLRSHMFTQAELERMGSSRLS